MKRIKLPNEPKGWWKLDMKIKRTTDSVTLRELLLRIDQLPRNDYNRLKGLDGESHCDTELGIHTKLIDPVTGILGSFG
jgi:hypothetical protein